MSFFKRLCDEGWFDPTLECDLDFDDIDTTALANNGEIYVRSQSGRMYHIEFDGKNHVDIWEIPGGHLR